MYNQIIDIDINETATEEILLNLKQYRRYIKPLENGEYYSTISKKELKEITILLINLGLTSPDITRSFFDSILNVRYTNLTNSALEDSLHQIIYSTAMDDIFFYHTLLGIMKNYIGNPYSINVPEVLTQTDSFISAHRDSIEQQSTEIYEYIKKQEFTSEKQVANFLYKMNLENHFNFKTAEAICGHTLLRVHQFDQFVGGNPVHYLLQDIIKKHSKDFLDEYSNAIVSFSTYYLQNSF